MGGVASLEEDGKQKQHTHTRTIIHGDLGTFSLSQPLVTPTTNLVLVTRVARN